MKPDTYFRHAGRPPCTHANTASAANASPHASFSGHSNETLRTTAESCASLTGSEITSQFADGLPNWTDNTKEPNACTQNDTDASGSSSRHSDSSAEMAGAHQTPTPSPQPKHGEITSHGASSPQPKRRGRPRKSP